MAIGPELKGLIMHILVHGSNVLGCGIIKVEVLRPAMSSTLSVLYYFQ